MTDTFKNGGELVDLGTWYAGRDKVQHAVAGFMLAAACRRVGIARPVMLVMVVDIAAAWEVFEELRYLAWRRALRRWLIQRDRGGLATIVEDGEEVAAAPPPRPQFCDESSWRDIVATLAGALLAMP